VIKPPAGHDPATCGLQNQTDRSEITTGPTVSIDLDNRPAYSPTTSQNLDSEVQRVADVWPSLPTAIRRAILTLIEAEGE